MLTRNETLDQYEYLMRRMATKRSGSTEEIDGYHAPGEVRRATSEGITCVMLQRILVPDKLIYTLIVNPLGQGRMQVYSSLDVVRSPEVEAWVRRNMSRLCEIKENGNTICASITFPDVTDEFYYVYTPTFSELDYTNAARNLIDCFMPFSNAYFALYNYFVSGYPLR